MSPDKNHIRLRSGAKTRPLNIPTEQIDAITKIISDPKSSPKVKHETIKKTTGKSPCCLCLGIPSVELSFRVGTKGNSVKVLEYYCLKCLKIVFEREKLEPENKDELPAFYGCVNVDQIPAL